MARQGLYYVMFLVPLFLLLASLLSASNIAHPKKTVSRVLPRTSKHQRVCREISLNIPQACQARTLDTYVSVQVKREEHSEPEYESGEYENYHEFADRVRESSGRDLFRELGLDDESVYLFDAEREFIFELPDYEPVDPAKIFREMLRRDQAERPLQLPDDSVYYVDQSTPLAFSLLADEEDRTPNSSFEIEEDCESSDEDFMSVSSDAFVSSDELMSGSDLPLFVVDEDLLVSAC